MNRHKGTFNRASYSKGLTLIEVMISMVIGLLLLSGAISLFINNKRVFRENNQNAQLQEAARFSLGLLTKDIRHAGFIGCHDNINNVRNWDAANVALIPPNNTLNVLSVGGLSLAIEGLESTDTQWRPSANTTDAVITPGGFINDRVVGTDAISIRYFSGDSQQVIAPFMTNQADPMFVTTVNIVNTVAGVTVVAAVANDFVRGEILAVTDCSNAEVFQLTGRCTSTAATTLYPVLCGGGATGAISAVAGTANGFPGNRTAGFNRVYEEGTQLRRYIAARYFIGNGQYGGPSLYRRTLRNVSPGPVPNTIEQSQELVEGVEHMEIMYGVDTSNPRDGQPNNYQPANAIVGNAWDTVVSVKIALLIRTIDQNFTENLDTGTYSLLGNIIDPVDLRVRRRVFSTTIQIKNRI